MVRVLNILDGRAGGIPNKSSLRSDYTGQA